jgi:hypothetical protein
LHIASAKPQEYSIEVARIACACDFYVSEEKICMIKRIVALGAVLSAGLFVSSALATAQPVQRPVNRPMNHPIIRTMSRPVQRSSHNVTIVTYFKVVPHIYDPGHLFEAAAQWTPGLGCFNDAGCPSGDNFDHRNNGLLFAKSGLTSDNVAGYATTNVKVGSSPLEFGYDIRNGGHCGAGAPRYDVVTNDQVTHFIGCNSPPPTSSVHGTAWTRMRWGDMINNVPPPAYPAFLPGNTIVAVEIVFDEGTDTGPDNSGVVILDNIEVNGVIVGRPQCTPSQPCN